MAEQNKDTNGGGQAAPQGEPASPAIQIVAQYVKDLSFENPGMGLNIQRPQIDFNVDLQAKRIQEGGPFEVLLKLRVTAVQEERTLFLLEIAYGGLFILDRVPDEAIQPILLIECPRLLFPFARRIVADLVSDGGLPPLMIEPIDFSALYRNKMAEAAAAGQAPASIG
ncbi:MAG: protein-export chaperone SecB [Alphaproteobacteria bacterium]|nr:protein-export chaperone SecB [Alphaproteobacteria bacterium]